MKRQTICICLMLLLCSTKVHADWFGIQLPFLDGHAYECTQNSFDTPTHGAKSPTTKYDIDFAIPKGTLLVAAYGGEVIAAVSNCKEGNTSCSGGFGNYIKIKHDESRTTLYVHLKQNGVLVRTCLKSKLILC